MKEGGFPSVNPPFRFANYSDLNDFTGFISAALIL